MDFSTDSFDAKPDHSLTQGNAKHDGNSQAVSSTSSTDDFEHVDPFSSHNLMDDESFFNAAPKQLKEEKPVSTNGANLLDDFLSGGDLPPKEPLKSEFASFGLPDDLGMTKSHTDTTKSFMDAERFQPIPPKAATPPLLDQIEDDYLNPYSSHKEKFVSSEDFLEDLKEPPPPEKKTPEPIIPAKVAAAPVEPPKPEPPKQEPPKPEPPKATPAPPQERPKVEPPKPPQAAVAKKIEERIAAEEMFCRYGLVESLIYWRDPKKSGAVFGAGLAILLAMVCFSVISVFAYLSLTILIGTIVFTIYKNVLQAVQKTSDGHPFKSLLETDLTLPQDKVQQAVNVGVTHVNSIIVELRRLFLVEDLVDSIKFSLLLWCLTYVGSWFNGMSIVIILFVALFTLPKVYENNKQSIDAYLDLVRSKVIEITDKAKAAVPIGKKAAESDKDK
ncbi:reticulon-1 isoform X2 [Lutzomyia longipalpis]|uniref:reticulon-1 isoform X2 n=1 Tax=Lutzomyia longipalpis TaxID=7200 RepID=UPI002484588D|nr:reticulon-1 isoform X2 [Lutzomyia longipalpis]